MSWRNGGQREQSTDGHVLDLGKDPVPGDPERVKHLAKKLHDFADDVGDALRDIKGMAGEDARGLGQPVEVSLPDGSVFRYAYDARGLPTEGHLPDGTDWYREYDERGNCTAVTDADGATYRYPSSASTTSWGSARGASRPRGRAPRGRTTLRGTERS